MGEITRDELSKQLREDIVYNSDKISKPTDIKIHGRTLINLLGRAGNSIYKPKWGCTKDLTLTLDVDKFIFNQSSKGYCSYSVQCKENTYYVLIAEVENSDTAYITTSNIQTPQAITNRNSRKHVLCALNSASFSEMIVALCPDKLNVNVIFRNVRVYEITKSEYDSIASYPNTIEAIEQIVSLYPYVDDVKCVVNPYIESNENLMSSDGYYTGTYPLVDVDTHGNSINWYNPIYVADGGYVCNSNPVFLKAGTYTLSGEFGDDASDIILYSHVGTNAKEALAQQFRGTFTIYKDSIFTVALCSASTINSETAKKILNKLRTGEYRVTLVKGSNAKSYDECHNSRILFETKLYEGEKITRDNSGKYVKNSEWNEWYPLDSNWKCNTKGTGWKSITTYYVPSDLPIPLASNKPNHYNRECELVSYNGEIVENRYDLGNATGQAFVISSVRGSYQEFSMHIPNTLTGWGDNYTPTPEEINAFFLGWSIMTQTGDLYNDSTNVAIKVWRKLWCGVGNYFECHNVKVVGTPGDNNFLAVCPTYINPDGYTPYRVIYKKPSTIEEVKTHGSLTIKDGVDVKVDSGLIINETNVIDKTIDGFWINGYNAICKNRVDSFIQIRNIKNGKIYGFTTNYLGHNSEYLIKVGKYNVGVTTSDNVSATDILYDYNMLFRDTVKSFDYNIINAGSVRDNIGKIAEGLGDCYEELGNIKQILGSTNDKLSKVAGSQNLLVNGDFRVWQRGTSFVNPNTYASYTADRWVANVDKSGGSTMTVSKGVSEYGETYMYIQANNKNAGSCMLIQNLNKSEFGYLSNQLVTVTYDIEVNMDIESVLVHYPPDYAGVVSKNCIFKRGRRQKYSFTIKLSDFRDRANGIQFLRISTIADNIEIKLYSIKVELGDTATPLIPRTYAEELAMCQRFYLNPVYDGDNGKWYVGHYIHGGGLQVAIPLITTMRKAPSLVENPSGKLKYYNGTWKDATFAGIRMHSSSIFIQYSTGDGTVGNSYLICNLPAFDAEIY